MYYCVCRKENVIFQEEEKPIADMKASEIYQIASPCPILENIWSLPDPSYQKPGRKSAKHEISKA